MTHTALRQAAAAAKEASQQLARLAAQAKDGVLESGAQALESSAGDILDANRQDVQEARSFGSRSVSSAALARMNLSVDKIQQMAKASALWLRSRIRWVRSCSRPNLMMASNCERSAALLVSSPQ